PWLLGSAFDGCTTYDTTVDACHWTGNQITVTSNSSPPGEGARIAWVNGNDVSMNDIVPRLLAGRANFQVFGPHRSHGAYGEISYLPPIEPSWTPSHITVL